MKIEDIIIAVVFVIGLGLLGFIFYNSFQDDKRCIESGGTNVRTSQGYECMKMQKL